MPAFAGMTTFCEAIKKMGSQNQKLKKGGGYEEHDDDSIDSDYGDNDAVW
jgi:hypothetical protein